MTTPSEPTDDLSSAVGDRVRELCPDLARGAAQIEAAGDVPPEVFDALTECGCLRMAVPAAYGGADLPLPQIVAVVEALTRADGAVGWIIGQVALAQAVLGYLPEPTVAEVYAAGPDVQAAGAAAPKGRAIWTGAGWRVSGRWPLVSGIKHASWIYLQCVVARDGEFEVAAGTVPAMRTVLFPAAEVRVLDTWRGLGLRASGSHDAHLRSALCPARRSCDLTGDPVVASAMARIPVRTQAGLVAAGFMVGTARAALDAIVDLAANKRPSFSTRALAAQPRFQDALGDASVTLAAARAMLYAELAGADACADATPLSRNAETRLRAVGPKVAELAVQVVDSAYALGGSSSVADSSPLQRRLRDARSISQHATLSPDYYAPVGALLAGLGAA